MTTKPNLCYFRGRGRMESIRWLLAAAGVELEEEFIETTEQYEKLQKGIITVLEKRKLKLRPGVIPDVLFKEFRLPASSPESELSGEWSIDGCLLFGQVPMVEIDGMVLTQTRAILSYLAAKHDLYGKDLKETVRINMYADGTLDLMMMTAQAAFKPPEEKEENLTLIVKKAKTRYFPAFEKILNDHGEDFLVGNKFSWADIQLSEAILIVEELDASVLSNFPLLKAFKARISNIPTIKKFLQPGSPRKPPPDSHYVEVVRGILQF